MTGVSFVVPVRNGAALLRDTLHSIFAQADGRPLEVIVVDDGSADGSGDLADRLARTTTIPVHVIRRNGNGAAAALNAGIRAARFPIVCQVDQDVRLAPGWMRALADELDDPAVAAAQGYYATDPRASISARVMGLDLEWRYAAIGRETDHACTGNVAYRTQALLDVGLFDESMGYGYDNDMSYRLRAAGHALVFCRRARSLHRWRDGVAGYLGQQYGFGYGRLDVVAKHPGKIAGDRVSPASMMLHPLVMLAACLTLAAGIISAITGGPSAIVTAIGCTLVVALGVERGVAGCRAARRFRDPAALLFPALHLLRDLAWVAAIVMWSRRRLERQMTRPAHSMRPRRSSLLTITAAAVDRARVIGLIPAHNEASNLESVVDDIGARRPDIDLMVIDDGSTDDTPCVLERLGVPSMRFPERMGIGSAMRAGLRYAVRLGYDVAVRLDGDGQHGAADIDALLAPLLAGEADVVLGTRYTAGHRKPFDGVRLVCVPLAKCLTALTGRPVTDPTSGFCAFGPAAVRLLADHHPDGYAEPELRLFLNRNRLRVIEVPVIARSRLSGRTSLTTPRVALAAARVLLALLIVPLRAAVRETRP